MNYPGKFDAKVSADGSDLHSNGHVHVETVHATHAPSDAIVVPDAHLLFNGEFKRSGVDLILSGDDRELVFQDYFKGEKRAALSSPDGAHLTGELVNALAGHVDYAQADGSASVSKVIGHVTKLVGTATAIRNGVSIILNNGDNVEKGDVLQSGANSTLGITFIDGTVFGLSSNARMVLNEMVYDPNGSNNSSLLSLVAGTITFVAGETAKHGDMKIDTPVATMGIRGTAVLVEIDFTVPGQGGTPDAKFQVLVEPDGTTGSYILFDKTTLTPLAVVDKAGQQINISNGILSQTTNPLSPEVQKLITDVFSLKFSDNSNPNTNTHFTDSLIPQSLAPVKLASGLTATPVVLFTDTPTNPPTTTPNNASSNIGHIGGPPTAVSLDSSGRPTTSFQTAERTGKTGDTSDFDTVSGRINFVDVNAGDKPTVSSKFDSFIYKDAHGNIASLNAQQISDVAALELNLTLTPDPGNNNNGTVVWTYNDPASLLSVPDSKFDFLAAGETLQLTYLLKVDNNFAPADEATTLPITITITGTNDVPVITTGPQTIGFVGGKATQGGFLTPNAPTSGTLTFKDADLTDIHTIVSTDLTSATLAGAGAPTLDKLALDRNFPGPMAAFESALSASVTADSTGTGTGTISWKLADLSAFLADFVPDGETLTLTYTVTVKDSQNAITTQNVIVTITGNNTPAVVWVETTDSASTAPGDWNGASNWETGTVPTANDDAIIITNQLQGKTPYYPVTIKSALDGGAAAFAKSVTMNDFGDVPPELDNFNTLTIGGQLGLSADAIVENFGTISVGGLAEILNQSVLQNFGTINLAHGGDFIDQSRVTNSGTIEVTGGTLDVDVAVANTGGIVQVDSGATLKLNGAAIDGGIIADNSRIDVAGNSSINGTTTDDGLTTVDALLNGGGVTVESGVTLTLDNVTVTGTTFTDTAAGAIIQVDSDTTLTLDNVTVSGGAIIDNGTIQIDDGNTLTLNGGVTIDGGTINNGTERGTGIIDINGTARIDGNATLNDGGVTIESGVTLTLDNVTVNGTTFTDTAGGAIIQVDIGDTLKLNGATINGGTVTDNGTIDIRGAVTLESGVAVNGGAMSIASGATLDIENAVTGTGATLNGVDVMNSGTIQVDGPLPGTTTINLVLDGGTTVTGGALLIHVGFPTGNVEGTVEIGTGGATLDQVTVTNNNSLTVDDSSTLTLSQVTINGGTINDGTAGGAGGTIDVADNSSINGTATINAILNNGGVTIDSDVMLTLDNVTVNGTIFTDLDTSSTIQIDSGNTLAFNGATINGGTLNVFGVMDSTGTSFITGATIVNVDNIVVVSGTLTIDPTPVTNTGTIEVTGDSTLVLSGETITNSVGATKGTIVVDGTDLTHFATLDLEGSTINGGALTISGLLDSTGTSFINDATITNTGTIDVTSGTLIIDATCTFNNSGTLETNGGNLIIDAALSGNLEIKGGAILELGACSATAYSNATVTFDDNSTGTLKLDHSERFGGTVAGLDDNTLDLLDITSGANTTVIYSGDKNGGILTIVSNVDPTQVAHIQLTGDYTGVTWVATSDGNGGTTVTEAPGVIAGLTNGNAVEGTAVSVAITDGGQPVTPVSYQWQIDGKDILNATNASYLPIENDEGHALTVKITYIDALNNTESKTVSAGTVAEKPGENATISLAGLDSQDNAVEGQQITATVTETDIASNTVFTYTWTVGGQTVQGVTGNTYTPGEADEGKTISVAVSFIDTHGNTETGTISAGTVQEKPSENAPIALAGLDSHNNAVQGQQITAMVTETDTASNTVYTYTWTVGGQTVQGVTGNTYTPSEADEGKTISVAVSFTDTHGFTETGTASAGTVQESAANDLVATLDSMTAKQHVTMHVLGVTDGGSTVTTGLSYAWQDSTDNGTTWQTVGINSSYTPGESDEGKLMQLVVTYTDASGSESSTYSLGMPNDLVATLDSTAALQGSAIHVTGVKDGGGTVSSGVSYTWQVSNDDGHSWTTVGSNSSSYTPTSNDAGELLQVVVTYATAEENESTTDSLGIVATKAWLGGSYSWQTASDWSPSGVPASGDYVLVNASGTYTITIDDAAAAHSLVVNDSGATVEVLGGNTLTLGGDLTIEAGNLQVDSGATLRDIAASATITGSFTDNGTIEVAGGKLEIASAANSGGGTFKIDAGATLQFDHADSLNVAFAGSGELILKDPTHFSGTISDSGGSMTSTAVIDVAGFDSSATVSYSGTTSSGIVTISEAGHTTVQLHVGANSGNWNAPVTDGNGGILIVDPPASTSQAVAGVVVNDPGPAASSTIVASATNQTLTGFAASDTFVFNFAGVGHNIVTDFHPDSDTLQFKSPIFASALAAFNAAVDDGHGNTVVTIDAHDTITLSGILKAQLHASDFHVV